MPVVDVGGHHPFEAVQQPVRLVGMIDGQGPELGLQPAHLGRGVGVMPGDIADRDGQGFDPSGHPLGR